MKKEKSVAIVLAAGQGKRMGTTTAKQYLELAGYPVLYHSLKAFQDCEKIEEIILVTGTDEISYCREKIVEKYKLDKVKSIISGGKERYDSVWQGLQEMSEDMEYVFIHDGARPMLTQDIIQNGLQCVKEFGSAIAGVPSKDTVKLVDDDTFAKETPERKYVWNIQTPQIFAKELVYEAYQKMMDMPHEQVTDDAMVVETYLWKKVKIYEASYKNIKITTPEDLEIAELFI